MEKKKTETKKKSALEVVKSLYWLWFTLIAIFIICIVVFIFLYKYFQKKYEESEDSCGDQFNINDELEFSSFDRTKFCLSAKQYQNQQICFELDKQKKNVIIDFGKVPKNFGSIDDLQEDENGQPNFTIAGQNLIIFKYPFASNTVCIRNLSQAAVPGRLCYNFDKNIAFVSAPTNEYITDSKTTA